MPQTIDLINFPLSGTDVSQWPKLTCTQPGQLDLQDAGLRLPSSRDILFQDNGQIRAGDDTHRLVFDRVGGLLELHEAGTIRLLTGGPTPTERLRILATGQVGIGTATPTSLLHVTGDTRTDGALRVAGQVVVGGPLTVESQVGIGTATPTQKLEVVGTVKATAFQLQQGTAINEFSSDGKLADNSDAAVPTERAVKEYIDNLLVGCVTAFATTTPPPGWLECNGQAISRTEHARLFARISTTFGQGDGATTFNVPDLRGLVIRGWDHGRGLDSGRSFGSLQGDAFQDHQHSFSGTDASIGGGSHSHVDHNGGFWENIKLSGGGNASIRQYIGLARTWAESHAHGYRPSGSVSNAITGSRASETRIKNLALMYCIKS